VVEEERSMSQYSTTSGYKYDESISALQKMIRRGDEVEAMYWAIELEGKYYQALWDRLEVISHEDIGITSMNTILFIRTCKEQYLEFRGKESGSRRLMLSNAILALCRAQKTRVADHFNISSYRRLPEERKEIPDVAKDVHTRSGEILGRDWDHFFEEGTILLDGLPIDADPYKESAVDRVKRDIPRVGEEESQFNE
jgi:replication-associated recombination protein RarA